MFLKFLKPKEIRLISLQVYLEKVKESTIQSIVLPNMHN